MSNLLNNNLENIDIFFHLLNDFLVILAFSNIRGMFLFFKLNIIFGQISDSTKIATDGFHWLKNLLVMKFTSIGKNWWIVFLNLNLLNTFAELNVLEVKSIFFIPFFFSNFSINGIMLSVSPTLEPWNQINFAAFGLSLNIPIFSKNLFGCSLLFKIL